MNERSQLNMEIHLIVLAAIIITVNSDEIYSIADNEVISSYREYKYLENHFATTFYEILAKNAPANFIYSPLCAHIALSTLAIGARGRALGDIRNALIDVPDSKTIDKYEKNPSEMTLKEHVNFFNQLFIDDEFKVLPEYKEAVKLYRSAVTNVNFTDPALASHQINIWSKIVTNGRISSLVSEASLINTKLLVINSLYFKAMWVHKFGADTMLGTFYVNGKTRKQVPMMYQRNLFNYQKISHCDAEYVKMPLRTANSRDSLNMYILVPIKKNGLKKLEENFHTLNFTAYENDRPMYNIDLRLPKFKIDSIMSLKEPLKDMGLRSMFDDTADFSGISNNKPLKVEQILQKAYIEVDEEGCEASTTSAVHNFGPTELKHLGNLNFEIKHPFMVVITSNQFVIFAGRVNDPTALYY